MNAEPMIAELIEARPRDGLVVGLYARYKCTPPFRGEYTYVTVVTKENKYCKMKVSDTLNGASVTLFKDYNVDDFISLLYNEGYEFKVAENLRGTDDEKIFNDVFANYI